MLLAGPMTRTTFQILQSCPHKSNLLHCTLVRKAFTSARRMSRTSATKDADAIESWIEENLEGGKVTKKQSMGGSSWSSASVYITEEGQKYFVKESRGRGLEMFLGEAKGLQAMHETHTLRIPKVWHYGELSNGAFLIMEHMKFGGRSSQESLGRGLAKMHLAPLKDPDAAAGNFGFEVDNTIGGTEQPNGWMDNWVDFVRERRIGHMLRLINDPGLNQLGDKLLPNLHKFFEGIEVKPSLLHGDLWSGNMSPVEGGDWSILDPAVYYGHHEADFGFADRRQLYLAYHFLNHEHLFSGYRSQAAGCLQHLVNKL